MYEKYYEPVKLQCQACGRTLRILSNAEAQHMANNPYAYVVYCKNATCQDMMYDDMRREGML